ncbi:MAG: hypothetical protein RLP02_18085 [Coleofasciculus sp. C2-GNP5-27]
MDHASLIIRQPRLAQHDYKRRSRAPKKRSLISAIVALIQGR